MKFAEMKTLKKFLFTLVLLIGTSLAAFGQNEEKKEPPKKVNPPTINPEKKIEKPRDSNAPKTDSKEPKKTENQLAGGGKIIKAEVI